MVIKTYWIQLILSSWGGRTYREILNMGVNWPYPEQMAYVVSHHDWDAKGNIRFITDNIIEKITSLRNEPGKDIWLVGGGELISMLLTANLINEMQIIYFPLILGEGIPLFPKQPKESKWEVKEVKSYNSDVLMVKYHKSDK